MLKQQIFFLSAIAALGLMLTACSPSVSVAGQWFDRDLVPEDGYEKLMVTSLLMNHETRRVLENQVEKELMEEGIEVTTGLTEFPDMYSEEFMDNRKGVFETITAGGNQALLVISVLDEEVMAEYVRRGSPRPMDTYEWYGTFWQYYDYHYPTVYDPGYYTLTKRYYVEANLYDADTEKLVWSAQTESYDPVDLTSFSKLMAESIAGQLASAGLLAAQAQ